MIIGIDLGTTNSLVSVFTPEGPVLVPNAVGQVLTPSVVHIDAKDRMVIGASAKDHLTNSPEMTAGRFKRLMGTDKAQKLKEKAIAPRIYQALC